MSAATTQVISNIQNISCLPCFRRREAPTEPNLNQYLVIDCSSAKSSHRCKALAWKTLATITMVVVVALAGLSVFLSSSALTTGSFPLGIFIFACFIPFAGMVYKRINMNAAEHKERAIHEEKIERELERIQEVPIQELMRRYHINDASIDLAPLRILNAENPVEALRPAFARLSYLLSLSHEAFTEGNRLLRNEEQKEETRIKYAELGHFKIECIATPAKLEAALVLHAIENPGSMTTLKQIGSFKMMNFLVRYLENNYRRKDTYFIFNGQPQRTLDRSAILEMPVRDLMGYLIHPETLDQQMQQPPETQPEQEVN